MTGINLELDTCRICLQGDNGCEQMFPIFGASSTGGRWEDKQELDICEKIKKCTGIKIRQHHKLPSWICRNCMTFLNIAYKFLSICHNSHNYLEEYVFKISSDLEKAEDTNDDVGQTPQGPHEEHQKQLPDNRQTSTDQSDLIREYIIEEIELSKEKSSKRHQVLKDDSRSSATHSEEISEDYYDECWLEGEETIEKNSNIKQIPPSAAIPEYDDSTGHEVEHSPNENNTPSKILGISSDGAAVIEEKTVPGMLKKTTRGKKPHICEICGNIYDRRYALQAHMRRHRDEKPFECEICGQAFHCNFELSRHIRKHTGVRPFVCGYCKRSFGDRSTLLKHERIHRNERPYSCDTCGKSFTYSSVLKVHQLTHTGEKPYNCELCGKRFSRSHHLRAHLETLLHQNDPRSKVLLKQIKRAEEGIHLAIFSPA